MLPIALKDRSRLKAFTLIELLIVVAIIAILAAIAVPNFLEAQTRAKISRARADLRTLSTGLEMYTLDQNTYPRQNTGCRAWAFLNQPRTLERLTSPVAYLAGEAGFHDPFKPTSTWLGADMETERELASGSNDYEKKNLGLYWYSTVLNDGTASMWTTPARPKPLWYTLESCGPDAHHHVLQGYLAGLDGSAASKQKVMKLIYDATNGTVSRGSIWRTGGGAPAAGAAFMQAIQGAQ